MNKASTFGMKFHQGLSFSKPFMKLSKAEAVFWPGCALMNLDNAILERTAELLKRQEPNIGMSTCCCGQPTKYLFPKSHAKRQAALARLIKKQGVKRIYTACPNCTNELKELDCAEIIPLWDVLSNNISANDITPCAKQCVIHDPCPMRKNTVQQQAVRKLLETAAVQVTEPEHTRENTICCGNFHMMRSIDPAKSAMLRQKRLAEFPGDIPVTSYCEGCLDAFRSEGKSTVHLLELLFGKSQSRGWKNRIGFTFKRR